MGIKTLKKQKGNKKMPGVAAKNGSRAAVACSRENTVHKACLDSQVKRIIEQYQGKKTEVQVITSQQVMREASRLVGQHMKRLGKDRLEEEERRKAKDAFMERFHKSREMEKRRANRIEVLIEADGAGLQRDSSAVKGTEEIFAQISRKWRTNY